MRRGNIAIQMSVVVRVAEACPRPQQLHAILRNGGVGERLKPAVLKNEIADSLSDRKSN
jgi:hypothetical protein